MTGVSLQLTDECSWCHGTGDYTEWGPPGSKRTGRRWSRKGDTIIFRQEAACDCCYGTGYSLTDLGAKILEFVETYVKAKAEFVGPKQEIHSETKSAQSMA